MLRRLLSLILLAWVLGFIVFSVTLPGAAGDQHTQGAVVLTGGEGRVDRGLGVLRQGWAGHLLISGVDPEVTAAQFASHYRVAPGIMACCITLGYQSVDTRSNALELAEWVAAGHYRSVRVITSDWHMRRARWEVGRVMPGDVTLVYDAVPTRPRLAVLFEEYCKLLARRAWQMAGRP